MPPRRPSPALSALLARLRQEAGLSLYELERRSGINRSTLMRLENGSTSDPSWDTLNRVARALDVDPEELYDALLGSDPSELPSMPTYLRTMYRMSDEEIKQVQRVIDSTGRKARKAAPRKKGASH